MNSRRYQHTLSTQSPRSPGRSATTEHLVTTKSDSRGSSGQVHWPAQRRTGQGIAGERKWHGIEGRHTRVDRPLSIETAQSQRRSRRFQFPRAVSARHPVICADRSWLQDPGAQTGPGRTRAPGTWSASVSRRRETGSTGRDARRPPSRN